VVRAAHWAPVLEAPETELWHRMHHAGRLDWTRLRGFMVHFLADVAAYQITPRDRATYDAVHAVLASTFRALATEAGADAPLCVVAHSLGTVIASNYLYDLQQLPHRDIRPRSVRNAMADTPLERGETLAQLYTFASPIALFSLRYPDFGTPVAVPSPRLGAHHPGVEGRWVNVYDRDDAIAWPLRTLNDAYARQVSEDRAIDAGPWPADTTPLSHTGYWNDGDAQEAVAEGLAALWAALPGGR
jgi:hypothetical protein